jgi:hypothetical protein
MTLNLFLINQISFIFLGLWQLFLVLYLVVWIYAVIDIMRNEFIGNNKLLWLLVAILVPFGGFIYFTMGSKQKI